MTAVGVESQITEALLQRLAALVDTGAPLAAWPVASPDVTFPPKGQIKPDQWIEAAILRAQTQGIGINAWDEHAGIFQVTVVTKQNPAGGTKTPTQFADAVAAWFSRDTNIVNGAVTVRIDQKPAIASPIPDAPYTRTPVSIRYRTFVR
jgi:hypothetical protein